MKTVHVICEGQTEANFVKRVLSPYFLSRQIYFTAPIIVTKIDSRKGRMHKGGMSSFEKAINTLEKYLTLTKQENVFVTTMFDFYHLPSDTPSFKESDEIPDIYEKINFLETSIKLKFPKYERKFFPYLQLHEFETLMFTNLDKLSEKYFDCDIEKLRICLNQIKNPELINNSEQTAPSKRILDCIPSYDKVQMGVKVLEETNFDEIRKQCKHFNEWICKIENL